MSSSSATRLERALEVYCAYQQQGGDPHELLASHPDLAELLAAFLEDAPAAATSVEELSDFMLMREVGRGGVGVVFEAHQRSLGRRVALKMLHEPLSNNPKALARFHREAQILARLDHPGIVRIYAASTVSSQPWLAMEFVEGESLGSHLEKLRGTGHRGDSMRRLVAAVLAVATALEHAHKNGIVHRDVKPSNILWRGNDGVVLGDFGLARDASDPSLTATGTVAGTPHYMAPEQIFGSSGQCDARTDVFALGATLYECLTLRRAFEGNDTTAVLHAILTAEPPSAMRLVPGLQANLAAIVQMALEKDPDRRYATAGAFAADLDAFLNLQPVRARLPSVVRRVVRHLRRRPMAFAFVLILMAAVVFAGFFAWQAPTLWAAASARRQEHFEGLLASGFLARTQPNAEACYSYFREAITVAPEREEGLAGYCFAIWRYQGPEAALAELTRHGSATEGRTLARLQTALLRLMHRDAEAEQIQQQLPPPGNALELWFAALPLLNDHADRPALLQADQFLSQALRVAARPRLSVMVQWGQLQVLLRNSEQRLAAANALMQLWPDNRLALQVAGLALLTVDDQRARNLLERAIAADPTQKLVYYNLGVAQLRCGDAKQAMETLVGVMLEPMLADSNRQGIVELVHSQGDHTTEERIVGEWLQQAPTSVTARRLAGRIATRAGDLDRALGLFRSAVVDAPTDFDLRWDLAFALRASGELDEAVTWLAQLTAERPDHERTHALILDLADERQAPGESLVEHERWANACPRDAAAWLELAKARLAVNTRQSDEAALAAAERADYLTQGEVREVLVARAEALLRLLRHEEAEAVQRRAKLATRASVTK